MLFRSITETVSDFYQLLEKVNYDKVIAIRKSERVIANSGSVYPYYYFDIIPTSSSDNLDAILTQLGQSTDCLISYQLIPTSLTSEERIYLNEISAELGRLWNGMSTSNGIIRDETVELPRNVLSYVNSQINSDFYMFNILIIGESIEATSLSGKVVSLLKSGKHKVISPEFQALDLSNEAISIKSQLLIYPWNLNNRMVYTLRNKSILNSVPMAKKIGRASCWETV